MPYELPSMPGLRKLADGSYDPTDIDQALRDTSNLTDAQKVTAEYWADGPGTAFPPGHMVTFAQALSRMRNDTLDQDVKLFFALGNAVMDAGIAAWNAEVPVHKQLRAADHRHPGAVQEPAGHVVARAR